MQSQKKQEKGALIRIELNEELKNLRKKKDQKKQEILQFYIEAGKKLSKNKEPERGQRCLWDFLIREIESNSAAYLNNSRDFKRFQGRKIAKVAVNAIRKQERQKVEEVERQFKEKKEISKSLCKIVYRNFWQTSLKIHKFALKQKKQDREREDQKKRFDALLKKQLTLSQELASVLNPKSAPKNPPKLVKRAFSNKKKKQKNMRSSRLNLRKKTKTKPTTPIEKEKLIVWAIRKSKPGAELEEILHISEPSETQKLTQNSYMDPQKLDPNNIEAPLLLRGKLRIYQFTGLKWLLSLHQKGLNGILADEMGLGKTIQTIALLSFLAGEMGVWGPHLVVVPTTLLVNWEMEFKRWCPGLKIFTYFGRLNERKEKRKGWSHLNSFHVCITSYKIATIEQKVFRRRKWYFMILDEAQQIKNSNSQTWKALSQFQTVRRLLLTGTPLQNNLIELWSLLAFLMPNRFESHADFKEWFSEPLQKAMEGKQVINKKIIENLHTILRPVLLRRLKKDVEKQLPSKTEVLVKVPLSMRQRYLYDEFISHDTKSESNNEFLNLMNLLMQLRKTCNHPDLVEERRARSPLWVEPIKIVIPKIFCFEIFKEKSFYTKFVDFENRCEDFDMGKVVDLETEKKILSDKRESFLKEKNQLNEIVIEEKAKSRIENLQRIFKLNKHKILFTIIIFCHRKENILKEAFTKKNLCDSLLPNSLERISEKFFEDYEEFMFVIEKCLTSSCKVYFSPPGSIKETPKKALSKGISLNSSFHKFQAMRNIQLPKQKNLIYDSGKLNQLIKILRDLRIKGHKCLIFTQVNFF